jgi:uncharacterized protein
MKSPKEISLEKKILKELDGPALAVAELIFDDLEIRHLQNYANTVSITRLNYNDHGPVHMKKVGLNSIKIMKILNEQGFKFNLEIEESGTYVDSLAAALTASMLHDIGMTIGRENHEKNGIILAAPIIERILKNVYPDDFEKQIIIKSLALECMAGHMGTQKTHSYEAGVVLIADGCDMEKGRSRIPIMINASPKPGDIHQYSSASIDKVKISKGKEKPLAIDVEMTASVGFFQIEEVLFHKVNASTLKPFIELRAGVEGKEPKRYL